MNIPEVQNCPGCGGGPQPFREGLDSSGMSCDKCGFSASPVDVMHADYLANFCPLPDIRVAARRISTRSLLKYSMAKIA